MNVAAIPGAPADEPKISILILPLLCLLCVLYLRSIQKNKVFPISGQEPPAYCATLPGIDTQLSAVIDGLKVTKSFHKFFCPRGWYSLHQSIYSSGSSEHMTEDKYFPD